MADVYGTPSINPDDYGSQQSSSTSSNAMIDALLKPMTALSNVAEKIDKKLDAIITALQPAAANNPAAPTGNPSLDANTAALIDLSNKIATSTVKYEVSGTTGNFFSDFLAASSSDKKLQAVNRFGEVFGKTIERVAGLAKHSKSIDRLAESLLTFFGSAKQIGKTLAFAAAGLALFGVAVITFMQAITVQDLIMFIGIMGAIRIGSELLKGAKQNFLLGAASLALLGLAIWAFTELVDYEAAFRFAGSLTLIGGAMWAFGKLSKGIAKNSKSILISAAAMAAIGAGLWVFNKAISSFDDFSLETAGKTLLVAGAAAGVFYLIGKGASQIAIGAGSAALVGAGLWALSFGLEKFLGIGFDPDNAIQTSIAAAAVIGVLGLIGATGPVALAIVAGAAVAGTVGAAIWVLAKGVQAAASTSITEQQAITFGSSIAHIAKGLGSIGLKTAAKMAVIAPAAVLIAGAVLASVAAIKLVSIMPATPVEKFDNFKTGITTLFDTYSSFGLIGTAKATVGAGLMTLLSGATMISAGAIRLMTFMMPSQDRVTTSMASMTSFISSFAAVFSSNSDKFGYIKTGISSFTGISNLAKDIAETVFELGNLQFVEKKLVNGKLVAVGSRTMTTADFDRVGTSLGMMLSALTDPLAKIGDAKDSFSIGGFSVTNPFSNKVQNGISALSGIGAIFMPITELIKAFNGSTDAVFVTKFNTNLSGIIGGIGDAFVVNDAKIKAAAKVDIKRVTASMISMTNAVGQTAWAKNVDKFAKFTNDVIKVKSSINAIDINKIAKFNVMLQHMNDMAKNGAIKELVKVFEEFIDKFSEFVDTAQTARSSNTASVPQQQSMNQSSNITTVTNNTVSKQQPQQPQQTIDITALLKEMQAINSMLKMGTGKIQIKEGF